MSTLDTSKDRTPATSHSMARADASVSSALAWSPDSRCTRPAEYNASACSLLGCTSALGPDSGGAGGALGRLGLGD